MKSFACTAFAAVLALCCMTSPVLSARVLQQGEDWMLLGCCLSSSLRRQIRHNRGEVLHVDMLAHNKSGIAYRDGNQ
jgi:hypothetical protein